MAGNSFPARDRFTGDAQTYDALTYEVLRLDRLDGAARLETCCAATRNPRRNPTDKVV